MISIVVGYRNRELTRVKNSIESLSNQTSKKFELVFIDYGSELFFSNSIKTLLENYPFVKYHYIETKGWIWNRAHALNIGILRSSFSKILISDIDIIYDSDFISLVTSLDVKSAFYTFNCFYLNKGMLLSNLYKLDKNKDYNEYVGVLLMEVNHFHEVKYFDEYYMRWGVEDDDLIFRLNMKGYKRKVVSIEICRLYHQWHISSTPCLSNYWYNEMVRYYNYKKREISDKKKVFSISNNWEVNRIFKNIPDESLCELKFQARYTPVHDYNKILEIDQKKYSRKIIIFKYETPLTSTNEVRNSVLAFINKSLNAFNVNYQITRLNSAIKVNYKNEWRELLHFYIGTNRENLLDYYYIEDDDKILFYFIFK